MTISSNFINIQKMGFDTNQNTALTAISPNFKFCQQSQCTKMIIFSLWTRKVDMVFGEPIVDSKLYKTRPPKHSSLFIKMKIRSIKFHLVDKCIILMYSILKVQFFLLLNIKFSSLITRLLVWGSISKEL